MQVVSVQSATSFMATAVAHDDVSHYLIEAALGLAAGSGLILFAWGMSTWWSGPRRLRMRATNVGGVQEGGVILSGIARPAWAVATTPWGKVTCLWYQARIHDALHEMFTHYRERNAVPFVLDDGTGRILVLARRARLDAASDWLLGRLGIGQAEAVSEGASPAQVSEMLERPMQPTPQPFRAAGDPNCTHSGIDKEERYLSVGERVTVIGRAMPLGSGAIRDEDACFVDVEAADLTSAYVVGSGKLSGLVLLAGDFNQVRIRQRLAVLATVLGVAMFGCVLLVGLASR
jgi:hypothetical protein